MEGIIIENLKNKKGILLHLKKQKQNKNNNYYK